MRALLLCAAIAQALQFTTQQAKTPALLDAATTLKASARPLTKVLLDAAEGASDIAWRCSSLQLRQRCLG